MREAMGRVVDAFRRERGVTSPPIPGDVGLTVQFIFLVVPAQGILNGSSSFRLDRVAKYLSADGPEEYFRRGLQVAYQTRDAKWLADDIMDEVLGVYDPPHVLYRDHDQYVAAALAVPKNRARANAVYVSLLKQIGRMWGTLLAIRGYSFGESFVARNVGLRTIWNQGKWCVGLVFQDHDNLVLPSNDQSDYWPMTAIPNTLLDELFINGREGSEDPDFELICLQRIYRVNDAVRESGRKQLRTAIKHAYARTRKAMESDAHVGAWFHKQFIRRLRDWDAIARIYLARNGSSKARDWKARVKRFLHERGYSESSIADHCRAMEENGGFVERNSFLYHSRIAQASDTAGSAIEQASS